MSFSVSFAVACDYALSGGVVYGVELGAVLDNRCDVIDPAMEIIRSNPGFKKNTGYAWPTHHDGHQDLVPAMARVRPQWRTLRRTPSRPGFSKTGRPPTVHERLQALVFAVRDAEVLVVGNVPGHRIVERHDVP